jgi:hypothetical protein
MTKTKSDETPRVKILLLKEFRNKAGWEQLIEELRGKLEALPDFEHVKLAPTGESVVEAWVPARNKMQRDRLKALVNDKIDGWSVLDEQPYGLPRTF